MKLKRILAFCLTLTLLVGLVPVTGVFAFAAEDAPCEHHTGHTLECGYTAPVEGHECAHVCDENCSKKTLNCAHVHDEACGYAAAVAEVPEVPCGYVHDAALCGENEETCPHTAHDEACGYAAAVPAVAEVPCTHAHTEACYVTESVCAHTHDETCGYAEAAEGAPCTFVCADCAKPVTGETEEKDGEEAPACSCNTETETHTELCPLYVQPSEPTCNCEAVDGVHAETCPLYVQPSEPTEEVAIDISSVGDVVWIPRGTKIYKDITDSMGHDIILRHRIRITDIILDEDGNQKWYSFEFVALDIGNLFLEEYKIVPIKNISKEMPREESDPDVVSHEPIIVDIEPAEFGRNPSYKGVGPLLQSGTNTIAKTVPTTSQRRSMRMVSSSAAESQPGSKVEISTDDGAVTGSKEVAYYKDSASGEPIFSINLKAESVSSTTGESCDFVMVLDMSHSMKGENLAALKEACKTFVTDLYGMSKYSRVAIVTYGGDRNVNRFYIKSHNRNVYATAVNPDKPVLSYSGTYADRQKQEWYIEYLDNGYVRFINASNGQALTAHTTNGFNHMTWPEVIVTDATEPVSDNQKWKITRYSEYVTIESALKCEDGHPIYLDLNNGNTTDGTGIGMWETLASPTYWNLNIVSLDPGYETYYWTDSTSSKGYSYRTDHASAETAFLTVSQDGGESINQKLINAIDALAVYGEPNEGSHPGEAMEKATRIYQAVRYDDANDICEYTGEHYYDKKRGVLYFADGTPSPTDERQLNYYPDNNNAGKDYYTIEYDFEETYRDAQDASNWSIVLKSPKGEEVANSMQAYFINSYGRHEKAEYYDIGSSSITGCGATVYVLGTNLPTMDIGYETHPKGHLGDCVKVDGVLDGKGNAVSVCYTQVYWRKGGLFDSYDSRSNEFFYRLSSHRLDGSHITSAYSMTDAERTWVEKLYNSKYCDVDSKSVSAWNGRYPDMICRNQTKSYFVACDDQAAIKEAFKGIAQQTGKELNNLIMTDNITEYFAICDDSGNKLQVGDTITQGNLTGTICYNEKTNQQYVVWKDFNLKPGDGNEVGAEKFDFTFYVVPKDGFLGGDDVPTNAGASLSDSNGNPIIKYPDPDVNVAYKPEVRVDEAYMYYGASVTSSVDVTTMHNMLNITVDGVKLDLSKPYYGLEPWQHEYVDINIQLYIDKNKDGKIDTTGTDDAVDAITNITDDVDFKVKITVTPTNKEEPISPVAEAVSEGTIHVFYPHLTFLDQTFFYGQDIPVYEKSYHFQTDAVPHVDWEKEIHWVTLDGKHSAETENQMDFIGGEPDLYLSFIPQKSGTFAKNDVPVQVKVFLDKDCSTDKEITERCGFAHTACTDPQLECPRIEEHPGKDGQHELLLHVMTCDLTITKTGGAEDEPYVFDVYRDGEKYTEVSVIGNSSVILTELPVGNYSVTENAQWSWRYTPSYKPERVELEYGYHSGEIISTNTKKNDKWFNDYSPVVQNIYGNSSNAD